MNKTMMKYTLAGVLFGLCFPVGAMIFELIRTNGSIPFIELHNANPILWMIDSAPIFLGLFALLGGVNQAKAEKLIETVNKQKETLENTLQLSQESHENLEHILEKVKITSPQLVANVESLDQKILEIMKKLDETTTTTTSSIQGISNSLLSTSNKIDQTASYLDETHNYSKDCVILLKDYISGMKELEETSQLMNHTMSELLVSSKSIDTIVNLIDNIAKESRLLSLNASIEAARMGAGGKGFAVIAESMKSMSDETGDAILQIGSQVTNIQHQVNDLNSSIQDITTRVHSGLNLTKNTKVTIENISDQVSKLKMNTLEVNSEIHGQADNVKRINEENTSIQTLTTEIKNKINETKEPLYNTLEVMTHLQDSIQNAVK